MRGLSPAWAGNEIGARLMAALANAVPMPAEELPAREDRGPGLGKEGALVADLLKLLLKIRSRESNVAARLIARTEELELLAAGRREGLAILEGWRFDQFGRDALDLVEGRLAFAVRGGKLVMTLTADADEMIAGALLLLAGAATAAERPPAEATAGRCDAEAQRPGRPHRSAELGAEAHRLSGARALRWIRPAPW